MNSFKAFGALAVAALVSCSSARTARAQDTVRLPQTRPNSKLLGSGLIAFGVPYVSSFTAGLDAHPGDRALYVPVAGPWIEPAARPCGGRGPCDDGFNKGMRVLDGVLQDFGVLNVIGVFWFAEAIKPVTVEERKSSLDTAFVRVGASRIGPGYGFLAAGAF